MAYTRWNLTQWWGFYSADQDASITNFKREVRGVAGSVVWAAGSVVWATDDGDEHELTAVDRDRAEAERQRDRWSDAGPLIGPLVRLVRSRTIRPARGGT